jgi:pimeloyl-ACP methyl ester carboxylesterase
MPTIKLELITKQPEKVKYQTPLLFIHGAWHGAWCWDEFFLPFFADQGYVCHALSLRGHGGSDGKKNLRWTSIAEYVDDIYEIAGKFSNPPVLIGHSVGALVIRKYLEQYSASGAVFLTPVPTGGMINSVFRIFLKYPLLFIKVLLTQNLYHLTFRSLIN